MSTSTAELLDGGDYTLWVESSGGDAEGPLQRDKCRVKYLRAGEPAPTITGAKTRGDSGRSVTDTVAVGLRLGNGC